MSALVAHGPLRAHTALSPIGVPGACEIELLDEATLRQLFEKAYLLNDQDKKITLMTDLPDSRDITLGNEYWSKRVPLMWDIARKLKRLFPTREISVVFFKSSMKHGGTFPDEVFVARDFRRNKLPYAIDEAASMFKRLSQAEFFDELLQTQVVFAGTQFSITGFLQGQVTREDRRPPEAPATQNPFKGLSVIGFNSELFPSVRLITEKHDQVLTASQNLIEALTDAQSVTIDFELKEEIPGFGKNFKMKFDTRKKIPLFEPQISATGGVDNLPMGEVWMVPVDGGARRMKSRTSGMLPVQLSEVIGGHLVTETVLYEVEENMVSRVLTSGPISLLERERLRAEPFSYNIAELGFGALGQFGFLPLPGSNPSSTMNNEKLGVHVAFGLNAHWKLGGGTVSSADFRDPAKARHQDYVYVEGMQPGILVKKVTVNKSRQRGVIVKDGNYDRALFESKQ